MTQFNTKSLVIAVSFGILLFGITGIVNAQQTLPKGGDDFGSAIEIESGSYVTDHDISRKVQEYFKLTIEVGQMLVVKVTNLSTGADRITHTVLYNEDRAMLLRGYDNPLDNLGGAGEIGIYKWLPNSSQDLYVYYMSVGGGNVNFTAKGTKYDISIEDRFDARSQTDAGDTFEKALVITPGNYTAYLSGNQGTDVKDFYKLSVKKGETLIAKVTPPSEAAMQVIVYDNDRRKLKEVYASNPGAIVTNSVSIAKSGEVFVAVVCEDWCSKKISDYTLDISIEETPDESIDKETSIDGTLPGTDTGAPYDVDAGIPFGVVGEDVAKALGKGIVAGIISWIVGPIVFFIIIGIVIYFLLKKKRTPKV